MLLAGLIIFGVLYAGAMFGVRKAYVKRRKEIEDEMYKMQ